MKYSRLFQTTRLRLAGLYAGTMGFILTLCALGFYEAVVYNHLSELNHRLESVSGTLHDGLEASLQHPGQLDPIVQEFIPSLCITGTDCIYRSTAAHHLGVFQEDGYYIRFLTLSGQLLASAGEIKTELPVHITTETWKTLTAPNGTRYKQLSLLLKTAKQEPWGYMQIGRSLSDIDEHLGWAKLILVAGFPVAMLLVIIASWWLAGQAMLPIYQSYRQMQQFTADAAHELRTPLATIRANLEATFTPEATDADAWDTLRIVERQNSRLSRLVQDLLVLSHMDLQELPRQRQCCHLNDIINDLVEEFLSLALASNISLQANLQTTVPLQVLGSEEQLYRLVANLITNAIQYTPAGGSVTVHLRQEDHHAIIQVQDTGIGIDPQEQRRIFDRFYRVYADRSRHSGGSGLGLAIAQAIAQAHQGTLQVQSTPHQGSLFSLSLPLQNNSTGSISLG